MNVFVLYWHPEPKSFNHALFDAATTALKDAQHEVKTSNLHEMQFDPLSSRKNFKTVKDPNYLNIPLEESYAAKENGFADDIEAEIQKMEWCDLMIWQFPLWWLGMPAMMKGWVDRVFARRRTYGHSQFHKDGVFAGKNAMLSTTTGVVEHAYKPDGETGDIMSLLRPMHYGVLAFTGFGVLKPNVVFSPTRMTDDQRASEIDKFAKRLRYIENEKPLQKSEL